MEQAKRDRHERAIGRRGLATVAAYAAEDSDGRTASATVRATTIPTSMECCAAAEDCDFAPDAPSTGRGHVHGALYAVDVRRDSSARGTDTRCRRVRGSCRGRSAIHILSRLGS